MEDTRDRILHLLQRGKGKTAAGLAVELALATATVRRHLDILQRDNLVRFEAIYQRKGRPQYAYSLTEQGQELLPRDYHRLAIGIMRETAALSNEDLKTADGEGLLSLIIDRMAHRSVDSYTGRFAGNMTELEARVVETTSILQELGFFAEYERQGDNFLIKCYNCPYHRVALAQPRVCELDFNFVQGLLKTQVERLTPAEGEKGCLYLVHHSQL